MARKRSNESAFSTKFGDVLKAARDQTGLTHEELARRIEKSPAVLSMYESGHRFPPKTTFEAIEREVRRELRRHLREAWEEGRIEWRRYNATRPAVEGSAEAALLARRIEELGETSAVRTYLELPDEMREAFRAFLGTLPDMPIPKDKSPSIVLKFEKKKVS